MYRIIITIALIILAMPMFAETAIGSPCDVIPVPQQVEMGKGVYTWPEPDAFFHIKNGNGPLASYLKSLNNMTATDSRPSTTASGTWVTAKMPMKVAIEDITPPSAAGWARPSWTLVTQ